MNSNPLAPVWEAYLLLKDAIKVSKRVMAFSHQATTTLQTLGTNNTAEMKQQTFEKHKLGLTFLNHCQLLSQASESMVQPSVGLLEDLFVLSLWATFERYFRNFLQTKGEKVRELLPADLGVAFYQHLYKEIEYWKPEEMLEILKLSLFKGQGEKIGLVKEVLYYRNWIAHGKNPHHRPSLITPRLAYDRLHDMMTVLRTNE
jgi:hypothetical protein